MIVKVDRVASRARPDAPAARSLAVVSALDERLIDLQMTIEDDDDS